MAEEQLVRWFKDLRSEDVASVGGKNAALGELYAMLSTQHVKVPNGFALTATAYRVALNVAGAWPKLEKVLQAIRPGDVAGLAAAAAEARSIVYAAMGTDDLRSLIVQNYRQLEQEYGAGVAVAVRSSATAEDLPTASFAGQHESFLNVRGATRDLPRGRHFPRPARHRLDQRQCR